AKRTRTDRTPTSSRRILNGGQTVVRMRASVTRAMRVLLIEDHEDVADLVGRALEKDGHRIAVARSVAEADARMLDDDCDAVILDLGLPDGSGLEWCKRIREDGVSVPILVLTAQSAVPTRVAGLDAGADDFLAKPFAVAELRARLRALGRRGPLQR